MELHVCLVMKRNVPVPIGPRRNRNSLSPGTYTSEPDEEGWMKDGNPFWLSWSGPEGNGERELKIGETEVTVGGKVFKLSWFDEITGPGKLLIVQGDFGDGRTDAFAYCAAWNQMCTSTGTPPPRVLLQFGVPETRTPAPSEAEPQPPARS